MVPGRMEVEGGQMPPPEWTEVSVMREPDKQRFLDAVKHVESREVPLFELEADISIVNQMMDKTYDMALHSFELPVADVIEWNRRMGNDMIYMGHVWHLGRKEKKDADGRVHYVDGVMKDRSHLKDIRLPDTDCIRRRLDELFNSLNGSGFGVVHGCQTAGFTVSTAIGYEDFCLKTITDPTFIQDFQKSVHEYCMNELEMLLEYPIDGFKIASGFITNNGSMISPEMMDIYEYPFMQDLTELVKSKGRLVLFHIDGNVLAHMPRYIEMGVDIMNPIDPAGGSQNIYELKERFGEQVAFCGNIDVDGVLLKGTPEDVKQDVEAHIRKLSVGGGYIVASSHDLHQLIPVENVYAMRDAVHAWSSERESGQLSVIRSQ